MGGWLSTVQRKIRTSRYRQRSNQTSMHCHSRTLVSRDSRMTEDPQLSPAWFIEPVLCYPIQTEILQPTPTPPFRRCTNPHPLIGSGVPGVWTRVPIKATEPLPRHVWVQPPRAGAFEGYESSAPLMNTAPFHADSLSCRTAS